MRLLAARTMPWKNGGGVTHELWCEPASPAEFDVRISLAEVATSGPFSEFPGVNRTIVLLEGAGFRLTGPAGEHICDEIGAPLAFDGGLAWSCTLLRGPVRDFNVMVRRASGLFAEVVPLGAGAVPPGVEFVFAARSAVRLSDRNGNLDLPHHTMAQVGGPVELEREAGVAWGVRIGTRGRSDPSAT